MADNDNTTNNAEGAFFVYMGVGGPSVPFDVVHVRIHPSVTFIHEVAFKDRTKLEVVELCEGLLAIGKNAFNNCRSLKRIKIPSTVTLIGDSAFLYCGKLEKIELQEGIEEIGDFAFNQCTSVKHVHIPTTIKRIGCCAFYSTPLSSIDLPDGMEIIGTRAFGDCKFNRFRIPVNITSIPASMLHHCNCLVSVEIPAEGITQIYPGAFSWCSFLRNIALPSSNADVEGGEFNRCSDLSQLFGSEAQMMEALKHRFDNLPIHKMLYYQSYQHVTSDQLSNATNMRHGHRSLRSKLEPTGNQQDCLGMTPLHILACSTVQDLDLYKVVTANYPENLIVEDRWGELPLFYAVLGNHSSSDIVQFLVECYHSLYPALELDWSKMIGALAEKNAATETIQNLVDVQHECFPEQCIDWSTILDNVCLFSQETFISLVECSISKRAKAIGVKYWRDELANLKYTPRDERTVEAVEQRRLAFRAEVDAKLVQYETEYHKLKEATTILELVLWKNKMADFGQGAKKRKVDESSVREHYRINCGADIVIQHVLPYLLPHA